MIKTALIIQNRIFINSSGGYEIQIYNICRSLILKGWSVHYLAESTEPTLLHQDEILIRLIKLRHYFSFFNPIAFQKFENDNPSIVYQRSRNNFSCGLIGLRYAKKVNAKFVFGFGCIDDLIPYFLTKTLWNDQKKSLLKKIFASSDTLIKDFLFQYNIKKADLVISQNIEQQDACKKMYHRDSIIIRSIHPPSHHEVIKDHSPIICWIANARSVKQPELFLELILSLKDLMEKQMVQFILVFGKNIHKYNHTDLMKALKLIECVQVLGELTIEQANDIMEKSSVLVNTSVYEGFSNTFIQAWLRETPVVSLNSDPDDILKQYQIGFHSKTMNQLTNDVRFLIENENERNAMGKRARAYAEEHHNIDKVADQLDELFTKLIQKNNIN